MIEPRTIFKAHLTPDGKKWTEAIWVSVDADTAQEIHNYNKLRFFAEARNDAFMVPGIEFGESYEFELRDNHIWMVYPLNRR